MSQSQHSFPPFHSGCRRSYTPNSTPLALALVNNICFSWFGTFHCPETLAAPSVHRHVLATMEQLARDQRDLGTSGVIWHAHGMGYDFSTLLSSLRSFTQGNSHKANIRNRCQFSDLKRNATRSGIHVFCSLAARNAVRSTLLSSQRSFAQGTSHKANIRN